MKDRRIKVITYIDVDMFLILDRICRKTGIFRDDFINACLRSQIDVCRDCVRGDIHDEGKQY